MTVSLPTYLPTYLAGTDELLQLNAVKALMEAGANAELVDDRGKTPIDLARGSQMYRIAAYLTTYIGQQEYQVVVSSLERWTSYQHLTTV